MNIKQAVQEAFERGDIFICHWETCDGNNLYTVELSDSERLFEITEHNYNHIREVHPLGEMQIFACGCTCRLIVPNSVIDDRTHIEPISLN